MRKAVGAIIVWNNKFLLVHKVKVMDGLKGPKKIDGEWLFLKGGIQEGEDPLKAMKRELKEETGSDKYEILKEYKEKHCFDFTPQLQKILGFKSQETTMFLVNYLGDGTDFIIDEELDEIKFFIYDEVLEKLHHKDDKEWFLKNIINRS